MNNKLKGCYNLDFGYFKGDLVLYGFDTENDLRLAMEAMDRLLAFLSVEDIDVVKKFLEKYKNDKE